MSQQHLVDQVPTAPALPKARTDYLREGLTFARKVASSEAFIPALAGFLALLVCFWPMFSKLPKMWFEPETYYNHAPLVPFMAGYIIYENWDRIKDRKVKPAYWALVPLLMLLYVNYVAMSSPRDMLMSVALEGTLFLGVLFVAGWGWLRALAVPILFLLLGLPIWEQVIDVYTQPLQMISSDLAYAALTGIGFFVLRDPQNPTSLVMDHFQMYVGVPCSGLRMILAVATLVAFVVALRRLKWWANIVLVAVALPICILVNGFRITLIGIVGNLFGQDAGMQFHDYSGYLSILLLVFLLFKLSQRLGLNL